MGGRRFPPGRGENEDGENTESCSIRTGSWRNNDFPTIRIGVLACCLGFLKENKDAI